MHRQLDDIIYYEIEMLNAKPLVQEIGVRRACRLLRSAMRLYEGNPSAANARRLDEASQLLKGEKRNVVLTRWRKAPDAAPIPANDAIGDRMLVTIGGGANGRRHRLRPLDMDRG